MPPQPNEDNERAANDLKKYIAHAVHLLDKSQRQLGDTFIHYVDRIADDPDGDNKVQRHRANDVLDLMDKAAKVHQRFLRIKKASNE